METQDHWARIGQHMARMGPPQVPGPDLARQIAGLLGGCPGPTVLLGVTPAYADLGQRVLAFDTAPGMITAVWPGDTERRQAHVADWRNLPLPDAAARQAVGDGALNALPDRATLRAVLGELRRVLAPGGRAAIRVFLRRDPVETLTQVLQAAGEGRIASLNVLRWRIASALAEAPGYEVAVRDILSATAPLGDLAEFARSRGMDPSQAEHFLAYQDSPARYVFPDRVALAADAAKAGFACTWIPTTGYPGAEDCPIALLS